jgi:uncharacterized LabA/DUF88 family protein
MERVFVYIDGRNFFYGLKSLDLSYTDLNFDFCKFAKLINGVNWKNRKLEKIYYYNAPLKKQKNFKIFAEQQKLFSRLKSNPLVKLRLCKMLTRTDSEGVERFDTKGDDIWIACDMLQDANDNKFDIAILVSCDGDFLKLVEYVQKLNKEVENAYFIGGGSVALRKQCAKYGDIIGIGPDLIEECLI